MSVNPDRRDAVSEEFRIYSPESLGAALKHYREESGWSQSELAHRTGLNRTYLSELEGGHSTAQTRRLLKVFRELGLRVTLEKADW